MAARSRWLFIRAVCHRSPARRETKSNITTRLNEFCRRAESARKDSLCLWLNERPKPFLPDTALVRKMSGRPDPVQNQKIHTVQIWGPHFINVRMFHKSPAPYHNFVVQKSRLENGSMKATA